MIIRLSSDIMKIIWIVLALIALFAIISIAMKTAINKISVGDSKHGYKQKLPMSENEQNMYWRLIETLPNHVVLAQVGMSSCIDTTSRAAFNTIASKSIDFLICNKGMKILATVEIDDKTHKRAQRIKADITKNQALDTAGIKLIRWPAMPLPSKVEIVKTLADTLLERTK